MKKLILAVVIAATGNATLSAQCQVGFTWTQIQPNYIDFTDTVTTALPLYTHVLWDFGDGNYGWGNTGQGHVYTTPGTYQVCMTLLDSLNQASCSLCDSVTVTGSVICNYLAAEIQTTPAPTCSSCSDGVLTAVAYSGVAPFTYQWSTGQTTQSISGVAVGSYTCCITDNNGCMSCDTLNVTYADVNSCGIAFVNYAAVFGGQYLYANVTGTNSDNYTVSWNFGDATTGTGEYVYHQFSSAGTYTVCATVVDLYTSCTSTFCDTVIVASQPPACMANMNISFDPIYQNQIWVTNLSYGNNLSYTWSWGDNTPDDTGAVASHVYTTSGLYNFCLMIADQNMTCMDTACTNLWTARVSNETVQAPFFVNVIPPVVAGISEHSDVTDWTLYPNPTNNYLLVRGDGAAQGDKYIIADMTGRSIRSGNISGDAIDVEDLAPGVFFFTLVKENGQTESKRFVRE